MKKINDIQNMPLHFVLDDGRIVGQFYNSRDKKYHLSMFVPCRTPPSNYLCGNRGNFSPSRSDRANEQCEECFRELTSLEPKAALDHDLTVEKFVYVVYDKTDKNSKKGFVGIHLSKDDAEAQVIKLAKDVSLHAKGLVYFEGVELGKDLSE